MSLLSTRVDGRCVFVLRAERVVKMFGLKVSITKFYTSIKSALPRTRTKGKEEERGRARLLFSRLARPLALPWSGSSCCSELAEYISFSVRGQEESISVLGGHRRRDISTTASPSNLSLRRNLSKVFPPRLVLDDVVHLLCAERRITENERTVVERR